MGKRGPPPEPSILKYIRGNPSKEPLNENEPTPELASSNTPPPATLGEAEQLVWHEMVRRLTAMRVLSDADLPLLERYCIERVRYLICYEKVKQHGEEYTHYEPDPMNPGEVRIKYTQVAPWATQMHRHHSAMLKIEQEFGMTPSSRSQVVANGTRDADPIASFAAKRSGGGGS